MRKSIIVITGLPASGKTTIARLLREELGVVVNDKDDFLETLLGSVQEFDTKTASPNKFGPMTFRITESPLALMSFIIHVPLDSNSRWSGLCS
jgi:shikimate kinase